LVSTFSPGMAGRSSEKSLRFLKRLRFRLISRVETEKIFPIEPRIARAPAQNRSDRRLIENRRVGRLAGLRSQSKQESRPIVPGFLDSNSPLILNCIPVFLIHCSSGRSEHCQSNGDMHCQNANQASRPNIKIQTSLKLANSSPPLRKRGGVGVN